jgi:hypothetical protein
MIALHLAVLAVIAAAVLAGSFTYLVRPPSNQIEAGQQSRPTVLRVGARDSTASLDVDRHPADEKAAAAYWEAAQAILKRAPNAQASAHAKEPSARSAVPLPKKRPILAP